MTNITYSYIIPPRTGEISLKIGGIVLFEITLCKEGEKDGRQYYIIHFFDMDTGEAGNSVVSPMYLEKLTNAVKDGQQLAMGYDKKKGKNFLYVKK